MGKVISFNKKIRNRKKIEINNSNLTKKEYLQRCKSILETEDYTDLLCGILDYELFGEMDPDMKEMVDVYYSCSE